jgi:hypothetical protein
MLFKPRDVYAKYFQKVICFFGIKINEKLWEDFSLNGGEWGEFLVCV